MEGPTALNNGAYRGQENGEVRQAPPKTTETPSEQHSDPDYDDVDDKGKNTTSSRNPVYGEGPPRTAHNQPGQSESLQRDQLQDSSPPYRRLQHRGSPLPEKPEQTRDSAGDYCTSEPHYDLPNQCVNGESSSTRFADEDKQQWFLPTRSSRDPVLTRYHTRESDNMLYQAIDQRRALDFEKWMRQQIWKWRWMTAALLGAFLLSVAAVGLSVKQLLDGCSCTPSDEPKAAPYTATQSFEKQVNVVNTTLSQEIKRLDDRVAEQILQIASTSDLVTSMNSTMFSYVDQLAVAPSGPPGLPGPPGPVGPPGKDGLPGTAECRLRILNCTGDSKVRNCATGFLSPMAGYDISGVTCSAESNETYTRMETAPVNGKTAYKCRCMLPIVSQTGVKHVKCHLRLWECKTA